MNMIERVARAIYEKRNGAGCNPWSLRTKAHKAPYLDDARAAIEAMREPTSSMCLGGKEYRNEWPIWDDRTSPVIIWRGMITAALNEGKERE